MILDCAFGGVPFLAHSLVTNRGAIETRTTASLSTTPSSLAPSWNRDVQNGTVASRWCAWPVVEFSNKASDRDCSHLPQIVTGRTLTHNYLAQLRMLRPCLRRLFTNGTPRHKTQHIVTRERTNTTGVHDNPPERQHQRRAAPRHRCRWRRRRRRARGRGRRRGGGRSQQEPLPEPVAAGPAVGRVAPLGRLAPLRPRRRQRCRCC